MKHTLPIRSLLTALLLFLFSLSAMAQIDLTINPTPESCAGNGALAFTVTGPSFDPGAPITYTVYTGNGPVGTPVTITSTPGSPNNGLTGLTNGNYYVIATQIVNNVTTTDTATVTIANSLAPSQYDPIEGYSCATATGTITMSVLSGVPGTYSIVAPAQYAGQAPGGAGNNVFSNLPLGVYTVQAVDPCGVISIFTSDIRIDQNPLTILPGRTVPQLPGCNQIIAVHDFIGTPGLPYYNPYTFTYTVHPPDGSPDIVVTYTTTANGAINTFGGAIPFYYDTPYSYDLTITDGCGRSYTRNNNVINKELELTVQFNEDFCARPFTFFVENYVGTLTFTITGPPGFVQSDYNTGDPTFPNSNEPFGITYGPIVPPGHYTATVTDDGCVPREDTVEWDVIVTPPSVSLSPNMSCVDLLGGINGSISPLADFANVHIVSWDPAYLGPYDDAFFNQFIDLINHNWATPKIFPPGDYVFTITSSCGDIFTDQRVTVEPSGPFEILTATQQRQGCTDGRGSVAIGPAVPGITFATVNILSTTSAEYAALHTFPYDVSANIVTDGGALDGVFSMNDFPAGTYVFAITDITCGYAEVTVNIQGYRATANSASVDPLCGGYNLTLNYANNAFNAAYYLQIFDPVTNTWTDPDITDLGGAPNTPYVFGAQPQPGRDSHQVYPYTRAGGTIVVPYVNANLNYTGTFRVLKMSFVYGNGTSASTRCIEVISSDFDGSGVADHFVYNGVPVISDITTNACASTSLGQAIVVATGVAPLVYTAVDAAGQAVPHSDTSSNLFTDLAPGTYTFSVSDACGNTTPAIRTINQFTPITIAQNGFCEGQVSSLDVPPISNLNYRWFKQDNPTVTLSTTASLPFNPYISANDAGAYSVEITAQDPAQAACLNRTLSSTLVAIPLPIAGNDNTPAALCSADATVVNLTTLLSATAQAGTFTQTGGAPVTLTGTSFTASTAGSFQFTYTVSGQCSLTDTAVITINVNETPATPVVTLLPIVCEGAPLVLTATSTTPGATFAWTTPNGTVTGDTVTIAAAQLSDAGTYTVVATSATGNCASASVSQTIAVTALVTAGADNNVAPLCSNAATNVLDLKQYLVAPFTSGGTFTVGPLNADPTAFDGTDGFDTANLSGTFDFIYSVTACGITDTATITFTINPTPAAPVATAITPLVCENGIIQLTTPVVAGGSYAWYKDGGTTVVSNDREPNIPATIAAAGNYTVTVTVLGCTSVASVAANVVVTPLPQFTLGGDTVLCPGQPTTITVNGANFNSSDVTNYTYVWSVDGVVDTSLTGGTLTGVTITDDTVYSVTIATVSGGCATTQVINLTLNRDPFTVVLGADCVNDHFILSITNIAEIGTVRSIVWSGPGISDTSNSTSIDITDKPKNSTYEVTVTNADGCVKVQSITVTSTSCMIPRGISPEEVDGKNDFFDLTNLGVQNLQIFNRYGLQVYEKNNYTKEWYGQSDKGDLPTGTYFYVVKTAEKQVTGWVYIQRNN